VSRLNIRTVLVRHLQEFFETRMGGQFRWSTAGEPDDLPPEGTIRLRPGEMNEKIPGKRQTEKGVAIVDFGGYSLMLYSPEENPPIGKVVLWHERFGTLEGPPDVLTWDRIAEAIKSSRVKGKDHVS
jgi:hypothetical protein